MNTRAIIVLHALLLVLFCMGGKTQSNRIPMRFVNYTRDAIKGIAEQLSSSSVMTLQNRLALDMILAENVCKMIGSSCCTYIPNNTAPDGSITKALKGLTAYVYAL